MSLAQHIVDRLATLNVPAEINGRGEVIVTLGDIVSSFRIEDGAEQAFQAYRRARRSVFDTEDWSYVQNRTVSLPLARLDNDVFRDTDDPEFEDDQGNQVKIHRAGFGYMFAYFDSSDYERYFENIVRVRLTRAQVRYARSSNTLFRSPVVATYTSVGRRIPDDIKSIAFERVRTCLAKLAIEQGACYEIWKPKPKRTPIPLDPPRDSDATIPPLRYEPNLVSYYKVARSSPFSSQSFLAYYNVLEYYFLRVTEDALHHQLRAQLNRADFRSSTDGLDRVIALVRRHGSTDDETDMLRKVLQRFVSEEDYITYVSSLETKVGEKLYTKKRTIFGEPMEISLKEGHAISNTAKVLKHIRNAIVHSSDRYKRDECHIPLSDSEADIGEFLPIIKYFAEQVIFGTAVPAGNN